MSRILLCAIAVLHGVHAQPLVDYHQHLLNPPPGRTDPMTAADLIADLDSAGIRRALVLSVAYQAGNPNRPPVENEYGKVRAENDRTSREVSHFPGRLRGFCGFNPLKDYALVELERCSRDPQLHFGIKLHFGNSDVDLDNPEHVGQLRRIFAAANRHRMAIVVHMHSSVTRKRPYGAKEARVFLEEVLPAAGNAPVQIAHLAGAGGYDDPTVDEALSVFVNAIARNDRRMKHVYFDASAVAGMGNWEGKADLIARRIRELGIRRVLYGSDGPPREFLAAFRKLPLTEAEFHTIETNIAPYLK